MDGLGFRCQGTFEDALAAALDQLVSPFGIHLVLGSTREGVVAGHAPGPFRANEFRPSELLGVVPARAALGIKSSVFISQGSKGSGFQDFRMRGSLGNMQAQGAKGFKASGLQNHESFTVCILYGGQCGDCGHVQYVTWYFTSQEGHRTKATSSPK